MIEPGSLQIATHALVITFMRRLALQGVIDFPFLQATLKETYEMLESDPDALGLQARVTLESLEGYFRP